MTAQSLAKQAYSSPAPMLRPPRQIEYDTLARLTHQLRDAAGDTAKSFGVLAEALHDNAQFWTVLACDVASQDNLLPKELRARIFYLAEFTHHHSRKVLDGEVTVAALLEINVAILKGLRQRSDLP
ncbi:flagellar biosynthesis regulator FlaF [Cognatishimia sp. WU-CL00825]|uniref:flagellar biosynthesis regulator FlaF n=1 Tax=Cognatishimia sp. WU-CL00825 TaxID=3127658 RepID=UPI0031094195